MKKVFLSEPTRQRALIFDMKLVDLYQVCSNDAPGAKMVPPRGPFALHRLIYGKHDELFFV